MHCHRGRQEHVGPRTTALQNPCGTSDGQTHYRQPPPKHLIFLTESSVTIGLLGKISILMTPHLLLAKIFHSQIGMVEKIGMTSLGAGKYLLLHIVHLILPQPAGHSA